jgi:predicted nucleic acid-binding protein
MTRIIVFDTNVLISALLAPASPSSTALRRALRDYTVVYSASTLSELAEKIYLPRFNN